MQTMTVFVVSKDKPYLRLGSSTKDAEWFVLPETMFSHDARNSTFKYGSVVNMEYEKNANQRIITKIELAQHTEETPTTETKEESPKQYTSVKEMVADLSPSLSERDYDVYDNKYMVALVLQGRADVTPQMIKDFYEAFKLCK
jgi:hypothetical protein